MPWREGCFSRRLAFSVNVDGKLSPCRHLNVFEDYTLLTDYWYDSETLKSLRTLESRKKEPCRKPEFSHIKMKAAEAVYREYSGSETLSIEN